MTLINKGQQARHVGFLYLPHLEVLGRIYGSFCSRACTGTVQQARYSYSLEDGLHTPPVPLISAYTYN